MTKPSNPKDAVGIKKPPTSTIPQNVIHEVGVAMMEGAMKYGRHNYRVIGVRASVYYDAAKRHLDYWWEGEDIDRDSGLSHITKAIASLVVLRDAMLNNLLNDDRPPKTDIYGHQEELKKLVEKIFEKYPEPKQAFTEKNKNAPTVSTEGTQVTMTRTIEAGDGVGYFSLSNERVQS